MDYMITTEQLTKKYKNFTSVNHVSLHIRKGSIYGFLGPNGAGKSTTMKMLLGLTAPTKGSFTIDGKQFPADRIAILKEVGSFIESPSFYANLTGRENLDVIRRILGLPKSAVEDALDLVGLTEFGDRLAKKYSLGMKQRLGLAGALLGRPPILILDEPTNDLDIRTLTILEDYLDNYDGIVITVSHDRYFLDRVVNRIFAFEEDGKICQYEGGYTDYVNRLAEEGKVPAGHILDAKNDTTTSVEKENQTSSMDTWKRERKLKFSYKEQKEYETIEDDIAALEQKIEELDAQTLKFSSDFVKLNEITKEKEQTEQLLEEKMERWEYLEDLAAKIAGQQ